MNDEIIKTKKKPRGFTKSSTILRTKFYNPEDIPLQ